MIISLDFDGVLHDMHNVIDGQKMGQPVAGSLEAVNLLQRQGHRLFVMTASTKARLPSIYEWLAYFNFPPLPVTNEKQNADLYIDDKGLRFHDWEQAVHDIEHYKEG